MKNKHSCFCFIFVVFNVVFSFFANANGVDIKPNIYSDLRIPQEVQLVLKEYYQKSALTKGYVESTNNAVLRQLKNKKYLYIGMKSAGKKYFAMDVTEINNPKLVFIIKGGEGDFTNLGQTWSTPVVTKVKIGQSEKTVIIFGGGYDETQNHQVIRTSDAVGNSVFMVDADNGSLLWSNSKVNADLTTPEMIYSIPASVSAVDRDGDGLADHLYVVDTGGQLFRLDIYNGQTGGNLIKGGIIASFSGHTEASNRRFFYAPDITAVFLDTEQYFAVALGTGFKAEPSNTIIQDMFYMVKDKYVFTTDAHGKYLRPTKPMTVNNLYDATERLLTSNNPVIRNFEQHAFSKKEGWYIRLIAPGEKVSSSPNILNFKVLFTTFIPTYNNNIGEHLNQKEQGSSRAYLVNLFNGNAVRHLNNSANPTVARYATLSNSGIHARTIVSIENMFKPILCIGSECVSAAIEFDESGKQVACKTAFECLGINLFGRFQRVQKEHWQTEIEKP